MAKMPYHMARCRDCGKLRKVTRREWTHRAPPRCWACGGAVDMTEPAKADFVDAFQEAKAITDSHIKTMTNRK
jgi:rRNA maturation protein Nop10